MSRSQLFILIGLGLLALIVGLVVFGPGRKQSAPSEAALELWGVGDDDSAWRDLLAEFKEQFPHLSVAYRRLDEATYEETLVNRLAAGRGPDIFFLKNSWVTKHGDKIAPLPDGFPFDSRDFASTFVEEPTKNLVSAEGQIRGLPLFIDTLLLFYNRDHFNAAGIAEPPKTWDEVAVLSRGLTRRDQAGDLTRSGLALGGSKNVEHSFEILNALMLQWGENFVDERGGIILGNNASEALKFYVSFSSPTDANFSWNENMPNSLDSLAEGKTSMALGFTADVTRLRNKNPHLNLGMAALPQRNVNQTPVNFPNYYFLAASRLSPHTVAAWQFMLFATSRDISKAYLENSGRAPARRDLISSGTSKAELTIPYRQALSAKSWPIPDETASRRLFAEAVRSAVTRSAAPDQAINKLREQLRLLMP